MNRKSKSFYFTFGIFLLIILAIGWSTYCNVGDKEYYASKENSISDNTGTEEEKVEQDAEGYECISDDDENINVIKRNHEDSDDDSMSGNDFEFKNFSNNSVRQVSAQKPDMPSIVYPAGEKIIKEFSNDNLVYSKTLGDWRVHEGTDFQIDEGSVIKSITGGKVLDFQNDPLYGGILTIEHNLGFTAYYCGLEENILVNKGDDVNAGQDIGTLKNVPSEISDDSHLHLMIKKDDKFIDPLLILDDDSRE